MKDRNFKFVSIKFEPLSSSDEARLTAYITRDLTQKKITVDDPDSNAKKMRETYRVKFRDITVKVVTDATNILPRQELTVGLSDLSVGGCCIALPKDIPVVRGGTLQLNLDFCNPVIVVMGTILGLRRD